MDTNDSKLYINKGKDENGTEFDLLDAIKNFSFEDLYYSAPLDGTEIEGCVAITGKQVIASYSKDLGRGVHRGLYARIMKELKGGGSITSFQEAQKLATELRMNYILARIDFYVRTDAYGRVESRNGCISFLLNDRLFSADELEQFIEFYNNYNESIKWLCSKSNFKVTFPFYEIDSDGKKTHKIIESQSLDLLKQYIESHVTFNINNGTSKIEDEIILNSNKKIK